MSFVVTYLIFNSRPEKEEAETSGIDMSASCTFCVGCHDNWTVMKADAQEVLEDADKQGIMGKMYLKLAN